MIDRLIEALRSSEQNFGDAAFFSSKSYKAIPISKSHFKEIVHFSKSELAFVDGGNAELIAAPNISLHFLRTAAVIFKSNERVERVVREAYVLVRAVGASGSIRYEAEIFSQNGAEKLSFDSFDKSLREGNHRSKISKMAEVARRFLEIRLGIEYAKKGIAVVLDGTLEASYPNERELLDELYSYPVPISALAKTSTILTDKGFPFSSALNKIAPAGAWSYYPVAEISSDDHKAHLFFVKLHPKSAHVFRFESHNKEDAIGIIDCLSQNSNDLLFPGYPYGLILADKSARISKKEAERLKFMILARSGNSLSSFMNAANAHDILDRI